MNNLLLFFQHLKNFSSLGQFQHKQFLPTRNDSKISEMMLFCPDFTFLIVQLTGYFVTTRLTPHSENNNIRGDYILCITKEEVSLHAAVDRSQTVVTWSVAQIRGFKSESAASAGMKDVQLLTLKVGRWKPEHGLQCSGKTSHPKFNNLRVHMNV